MALFDHGPGYEPEHLLDHYPWTALGRATVVDVGGSVGHIAISIARRFPEITCIVQDRPEVLAAAVVPKDLAERLRFEPHDFFNEQPVKHADVYYFRWILHDWADKYAAKILRALVPAMKPGAKVILSEYLIPEPGEIPMSLEREKRAFDLAMWELQNSKERTVEDWRDLFAMADTRFKLSKVVKPPNANLGILEVTWEG
jgi:SAM-dependent methyltransferase